MLNCRVIFTFVFFANFLFTKLIKMIPKVNIRESFPKFAELRNFMTAKFCSICISFLSNYKFMYEHSALLSRCEYLFMQMWPTNFMPALINKSVDAHHIPFLCSIDLHFCFWDGNISATKKTTFTSNLLFKK